MRGNGLRLNGSYIMQVLKENHKKPSQYAWFIFRRRTAFFSTSPSHHCCVKTVGPVEDLHLITTLVIIRYSTLSMRLSMMIRVNSELKCDVSEIVSVSIIRKWLVRAKDNDHLRGTGFIAGISANFIKFTKFFFFLSNFRF